MAQAQDRPAASARHPPSGTTAHRVASASGTPRGARHGLRGSAAPRWLRTAPASGLPRPSCHRARSAMVQTLPTCSACGFSTGPASPTIIAATASILSSRSHHGVRSDTLSSSFSPSNSATPGNRWRIGAGGTARRNQPQNWQGQKRQQQPGRGEPDAAQDRHAATPARASSAPYSHSSADWAELSV